MKKTLLAAAVLFTVIQFVPLAPPKSNPPFDSSRTFDAVMRPPAEVAGALRRACYDCHSNETHWPAYAYVAPVSWFVQQHVAEGRKQLNFSEWLTAGETRFTDWNGLEKVCVEMRSGSMPLPGYTSLHKDAELSEPEKKAVCAWVDSKFQEAR